MTISYKNALFFLSLSVAALNLSGCDYMSKNFYHLKTQKTVEKPPILDVPAIGNETQDTVLKDDTSHIVAENVFADKPQILIEKINAQASTVKIANAVTQDMPAIPAPRVIEKIPAPKDSTPVEVAFNQERLNALETRVDKITQTLNKLSPAIIKIAGIENDLDSLTLQLTDLIEKNKNTRTAYTIPRVSRQIASTPSNSQPPVARQMAPYKISRPIHNKAYQTKILAEAPAQKTEQAAPIKKPIKISSNTKQIKVINAENKDLLNLNEDEILAKTIEPAAGEASQSIDQDLRITSDNTNTVYKIRSGDHKGKTRLVFETSQKLNSPDVQIDNEEKIILINLGAVNFSGSLKGNINKLMQTSSLISSAYDLENKSNQQVALVLDLTQKTELLSSIYIAPGKDSENHRLVIDVKR